MRGRGRSIIVAGLACLAIAVVASGAISLADILDVGGGRLHWRFDSSADYPPPLRIPDAYPVGEKLYYVLPQFGEANVTIEKVELEAGPGVRMIRALLVSTDGSRSTFRPVQEQFIGMPAGPLAELPGTIHGYSCCEGAPEMVLELVFEARGEHELDSLAIDYSAGSWHRHVDLALPGDLVWVDWPNPSTFPTPRTRLTGPGS